MNPPYYIPLPKRTIFFISGEDCTSFLQGIITNDIEKVTENHSCYALMLTPQGKFLYDFFIYPQENGYYIDISSDFAAAFLSKITLYKLRSDVAISDVTNQYQLIAIFDQDLQNELGNQAGNSKKLNANLILVDPRKKELGIRALLQTQSATDYIRNSGFTEADMDIYELNRIKHSIPDGVEDLVSEKSFPLDFQMDKMNAIDFHKGCYVGQEVTARVHHRGTIRKSLITIYSDTDLPQHDTTILNERQEQVGICLSRVQNYAIALLNLRTLEENIPLYIGNINITRYN